MKPSQQALDAFHRRRCVPYGPRCVCPAAEVPVEHAKSGEAIGEVAVRAVDLVRCRGGHLLMVHNDREVILDRLTGSREAVAAWDAWLHPEVTAAAVRLRLDPPGTCHLDGCPGKGTRDAHVLVAAEIVEDDGVVEASIERPLLAGLYRHYKGPLYLLLGVAHDANADRMIDLDKNVGGNPRVWDTSPLVEREVVVYVPLETSGAHTGPRMAVRTRADWEAWVCVEPTCGAYGSTLPFPPGFPVEGRRCSPSHTGTRFAYVGEHLTGDLLT